MLVAPRRMVRARPSRMGGVSGDGEVPDVLGHLDQTRRQQPDKPENDQAGDQTSHGRAL